MFLSDKKADDGDCAKNRREGLDLLSISRSQYIEDGKISEPQRIYSYGCS